MKKSISLNLGVLKTLSNVQTGTVNGGGTVLQETVQMKTALCPGVI